LDGLPDLGGKAVSRLKVEVELRLPTKHVEFIGAVAKRAGVSRDTAFNVMLAAWLMRDEQDQARQKAAEAKP
jgi:hypothetical protein